MKKYSRLILRIHGTTIILAGIIFTVIGWVGTFSGIGIMKVLQTEPMIYGGLLLAYLFLATLGVTLWVGSFSVNTRPWHIIGFLIHLGPFAVNIIFWNMVTEYGMTHSGIILHIVFMLIESLAFTFYNKKDS
jgi:hypothetical protein